MANVKVFADKQTDKRTGQKHYASDLSMKGHKNLILQQWQIQLHFSLLLVSASTYNVTSV